MFEIDKTIPITKDGTNCFLLHEIEIFKNKQPLLGDNQYIYTHTHTECNPDIRELSGTGGFSYIRFWSILFR